MITTSLGLMCAVVFILTFILLITSAFQELGIQRDMREFRKRNDIPERKKPHWIDAAQARMKRNADQNYDWRKE